MSLTKVQINLGTTGNLSGSRSLASASFASRVSLVEDGTTSKTLVSGSAQLAADISGSFGNQRVGTTDSPVFNAVTVGTATVTGTLTAQEVHTEFESASILFTSGSTQFGNSSDDVHDFLGNTISGSATSTGSFGSIVTKGTGVSSFTSNVTMANNLDVDGTTNLDVVDIDGAVDMASTLDLGGTLTVNSSTVNDDFAIFKNTNTTAGASVPIFLSSMSGGSQTNVSIENAGAGTIAFRTGNTAVSGFGTERMFISATGEVTASGDFAITDRLTVGAWDNSNSHGHANINISADANEGADSYLNFAAGTSIKAHIAYDHHAAAQSQQLVIYTADNGTEALRISGSNRVRITQGLLEVGEHGVAGGQIVSDGSLIFNAGYNDSSTGNGDFIFQRYGESTTANTMAQIFSTGNAFFGDNQTQVNSSHFQYASTFGDTSAARVGFFNAASGNSSTDKTMHLNIGCMGHGTSAYHPTNMVIASINFLGQANDATYAGGGIDMLVESGGNVGRTSVGTAMLFRTMGTSSNGGVERMRITEQGTVHIKAANPNTTEDAVLYVSKTGENDWSQALIAGSDDYGLKINGGGAYSIMVTDHDQSGAATFRVHYNGTIYSSNTSVQSISDRRLKENIVDANSQWNDIKGLKFKNFNWKESTGRDTSITYLGLIADEVESVSPNLVEIDAQPKEDIEAGATDPEYKNVKYSIVWMKAVKALQEAMAKIETLEAKVEELEK